MTKSVFMKVCYTHVTFTSLRWDSQSLLRRDNVPVHKAPELHGVEVKVEVRELECPAHIADFDELELESASHPNIRVWFH